MNIRYVEGGKNCTKCDFELLIWGDGYIIKLTEGVIIAYNAIAFRNVIRKLNIRMVIHESGVKRL